MGFTLSIRSFRSQSLSQVAHRRRSLNRSAALASLVAGATALTPVGAAAQTFVGGTGDWGQPGSWMPGPVPNSTTAQVIFSDSGSNWLVRLNGGTFTINSLTYERDAAWHDISGGTLRFGGSNATIDVQTPVSRYHRLTSTAIETMGDLTVNTVEYGGLLLDEDSSLAGAGTLFKTGAGTLTLQGSGSAGTIDLRKGTLRIDGGSFEQNSFLFGDNYIGHQAGDVAALEVVNGGSLSTNLFVFLGNDAGSQGDAVVSGQNSVWDAYVTLAIGYDGEGSLTVEKGGRVNAAYPFFPGGPVFPMFVGGGDLGRKGSGVLSVRSGGFVDGDVIQVGAGDGSSGLIVLSDGGTLRAGSVVMLGQYNTTGSARLAIGSASADAAAATGAGALETPEVSFDGDAASLDFNHTETNYQFATRLVSTDPGRGAINHYAGTTTLTGDNASFSGTTTVSGGTLLVGNAAGGTLGGAIHVRRGARLGGLGTIGSGSAVTIEAGGNHIPGDGTPTGQQIVAGDYVNHGTLTIAGVPSGTSRVVVAGGVDITGASLDLLLTPDTAQDWSITSGPFTIIEQQGTGSVAGTFGTVDYLNGMLFLDHALDYAGGDGNDVTLTFSRNDLEFAGVARTRNQIAVGAAIDSLPETNPVWNAIALMGDADMVRKSFEALSGEIHAAAKTTLIGDTQLVGNIIGDRIRAAFDGAGASYAPVLAYAPGATPTLVLPDHAGPVFWSQGFGSWGSTEGDGNAAGLDNSASGVLVGADALVGDWRVGLLAGYSRSRFDAEDGSASGASGNYHLGLYGGSQWGALALRMGLAHTWHDIETSRAVGIPGFSDSLSTGYHAGTIQAFGELGYGIEAGSARFEPFANLAYVSLRADGFSEEGGAAALAGNADSTDVTFATLGLRGEHRLALGTAEVTLKGMLGWRHAYGEISPGTAQAFEAGGDPFTVFGAPVAQDEALVEAGLDLTLAPNASFGLAYSGQIASGGQQHGLNANLAIRF